MATDSPSTSSLGGSTDSYEFRLPRRSHRGRGRGAQKTTTTTTGVGRGRGGRRGKTKRRGTFILTEDEAGRLERLQEERKTRANDLVDEISEEGAKALLKKIAEVMPSLILDVAAKVNAEGEEDPEDPTPDDPQVHNWPSWCICRRCRDMPMDTSKVCCGMRPHLCTSTIPEMRLVITEPAVLQLQQLYRGDIFARRATTNDDVHKSLRHAAYRQFILYEYGRLGHGVRRPVPSCCTWYIRDKFPDPNNYYVEYNPGW